MARLRVAVSTLGLRGHPKRTLDWVAEAGFREIELPFEGEPFGLAELDASGLRDLQYQLADRLLTPVSVHASLPGALNRSGEAEMALERAEGLITRYAVPLRLPLVLQLQPLSDAEGASEEVLHEALVRLSEVAEHFEIPVNVTGPVLTIKRVEQVFASANSPFLGIALDPVPFVEVEADWELWLEELGRHIRHLYAVDGRIESGVFSAVRLGEGAVPWEKLVDRLEQYDFSGPVVIRAERYQDPFAEALRAKEFLEKL